MPHSKGPLSRFNSSRASGSSGSPPRVFGPALFRNLGRDWVLVERQVANELEDLVRLVLRDEEWAKTELRTRIHGRLRRMARGLCASQDLDDAVQEAEARIFQRLWTWNRKGSPQAWMNCVARRVFITYERRKGRIRERPAGIGGEDGLDAPSSEPAPLHALARAENNARLRRAVRALPQQQLQVVLLHYFEGLDLPSISLQTWSSYKAVQQRLDRARGALRAALAPVTMGAA